MSGMLQWLQQRIPTAATTVGPVRPPQIPGGPLQALQQQQQQLTPQPQNYQQLLHQMWQRYGPMPQPPPATHPSPTVGPMPGAMYQGQWSKLDPTQQNYVNANALNRPPPASQNLNPASIRIDFHKPEVPDQ